MRWFAYNGDADGICSMVQWGLVHGVEGKRITGVKRDIELLDRINPNDGDEVIVMDISLARNHAMAQKLAQDGIEVTWFDTILRVTRLNRSTLTLTLLTMFVLPELWNNF